MQLTHLREQGLTETANEDTMVVMILESAPTSLRGELSRFLIEPKAGVFVGKISAIVRDKLWDLCLNRRVPLGVIQVWSDSNEQGFSIRTSGDTSRILRNYEGLSLISVSDDSHAARVRVVAKSAGRDDDET